MFKLIDFLMIVFAATPVKHTTRRQRRRMNRARRIRGNEFVVDWD